MFTRSSSSKRTKPPAASSGSLMFSAAGSGGRRAAAGRVAGQAGKALKGARKTTFKTPRAGPSSGVRGWQAGTPSARRWAGAGPGPRPSRSSRRSASPEKLFSASRSGPTQPGRKNHSPFHPYRPCDDDLDVDDDDEGEFGALREDDEDSGDNVVALGETESAAGAFGQLGEEDDSLGMSGRDEDDWGGFFRDGKRDKGKRKTDDGRLDNLGAGLTEWEDEEEDLFEDMEGFTLDEDGEDDVAAPAPRNRMSDELQEQERQLTVEAKKVHKAVLELPIFRDALAAPEHTAQVLNNAIEGVERLLESTLGGTIHKQLAADVKKFTTGRATLLQALRPIFGKLERGSAPFAQRKMESELDKVQQIQDEVDGKRPEFVKRAAEIRRRTGQGISKLNGHLVSAEKEAERRISPSEKERNSQAKPAGASRGKSKRAEQARRR